MQIDQIKGVSAAGLMCLPAFEQITNATTIMRGLAQNSPEVLPRALDFAALNNFRIPSVFQNSPSGYESSVIAPVFAYFAGARLTPVFEREFNASADVGRKSMLVGEALHAYEAGIFKYHQVEAAYQILSLEVDDQLRQYTRPKPPFKLYSPASIALRTLAYGGAGVAAFVGFDLGTLWFAVPAGIALAAEVPLGFCGRCEVRNYEMARAEYDRSTRPFRRVAHDAAEALRRLEDLRKDTVAEDFPTADRWEFREAYFDSIGRRVRIMKTAEDFFHGPNFNLRYVVVSLPEGESEIRFSGFDVVHENMVIESRGEQLLGSGSAIIDRVDKRVKLDGKGDRESVLVAFVKILNGEFNVTLK